MCLLSSQFNSVPVFRIFTVDFIVTFCRIPIDVACCLAYFLRAALF